MGLEQARQALEESLSKEPSKDQSPDDSQGGDASPSSDQDLAPDTESSSASNNQKDIFDLDQAEKVRFQGKEWTRDELKKSFSMQSDYTKKTQALAKEREEFNRSRETYEREQSFAKNLKFDLQHVRSNPALAQKFKEIYPEEYHDLLDTILANPEQSIQQSVNQSGIQLPKEILEKLSKVDKFESFVKQAESEKEQAKTEAREAEIDSLMQNLNQKYPRVKPSIVLARVEAMMASGVKVTDDKGKLDQSVWEGIYKSEFEAWKKDFEEYQKELLKSQKQANSKARDAQGGGGTVGQPAKKMSLKDAARAAEEHFSGKGS